MAITTIHPIKSTLNKAIDYISDYKKTDSGLYINVNSCILDKASEQFLMLRKEKHTKGSVLARHLVQSFVIGEVIPEKAHEIGKKLCDEVLKNEYQYVLTTHIDKGHIHNHIIFNNVNMVTGKCYQSNKKTYHNIRRKSDILCKEYGLNVIDKSYENYKKYFSKKSYYKFLKENKNITWKSKLQNDIDKAIIKSNSFDEFLAIMGEKYYIKFGKYISFKDKSKPENSKFTRAKTIGENYTEKNIQYRIINEDKPKNKKYENIIVLRNNENKGLVYWAKKQNLKIISNLILEMREEGIKSVTELDKKINEKIKNIKELKEKIQLFEKEYKEISKVIELNNIIKENEQVYSYYKDNKEDKSFYNEYRSEIIRYEKAVKSLNELKSTKKIDDLRKLNDEIDVLYEEYFNSKNDLRRYNKYKKNYDVYMNNDKNINKNNELDI